jgi:L-fuconolactonase
VHVPRIRTLAKRFPNLSIVIDHCAKPDIARGLDTAWQPWADDMAALAKLPNVSCKLSGLLTEAGKSPQADDCKPWVEHVLNVFGAERMMWGSDWTVLELAGDHENCYRKWFEMCQQYTKQLSPLQQDNIFNNTVKQVYKL